MASISKSYIPAGRWFFTQDQLNDSPSRRDNIDLQREQRYRRESAKLIFDAGQILNLSTGTINTAVVYMHRFYMFHSFSKFHKFSISATALLLAAKVEDNFRKFDHVFAACQQVFENNKVPDDRMVEWEMDEENVFSNETLMLQTLGFDGQIEHPHTHIIKFLKFSRLEENRELTRACYQLATQVMHRTTISLHFEPSVIACLAIHTALKWRNLTIPVDNSGRNWYFYVDPSVNLELIEELVDIFQDGQPKPEIKENIEVHRGSEYHQYVRRHVGSPKLKATVDLPVPKFRESSSLIVAESDLWKGNFVLMDEKTQVNEFRTPTEQDEAAKKSGYKERYKRV